MIVEIPDTLVDQVVDAVAGRLVGTLAEQLEARAEYERTPWMSMDQLAEYTGLSKSTVKVMVARGQIPRHGDGRALFHRIEVDEALLGYSLDPTTKGRTR